MILRTEDFAETGPCPKNVQIGHYALACYENDYLSGQAYLEPFPEELVDPADSGKGRV